MNVTEEQMIAALEGKFFRGPQTFHQTQLYIGDEIETRPDKGAKRIGKKAIKEQLEREAEISPTRWRVPVSLIVDTVCTAHDVSLKDLQQHDIQKARRQCLVVARQHAGWLIKRLRPDISSIQIAQKLNYRDHTSVLHGIKRFEEIKRKYVPEIEQSLAILRERTGDQTLCLV